MANAAKAKGTRWESSVRDFLRGSPALYHARRVTAQGKADEGDIHVEPFALQCKDCTKHDLAGWVRDAEAQALAGHQPYGAAVVKSRGKPVGSGYVVMSLDTFRNLLAADVVKGTDRPPRTDEWERREEIFP